MMVEVGKQYFSMCLLTFCSITTWPLFLLQKPQTRSHYSFSHILSRFAWFIQYLWFAKLQFCLCMTMLE